METFSALLAICPGNSPATGEFPAQRPVTRSFDVFFDLCLNEGLSKQSWGWWFDHRAHYDVIIMGHTIIAGIILCTGKANESPYSERFLNCQYFQKSFAVQHNVITMCKHCFQCIIKQRQFNNTRCVIWWALVKYFEKCRLIHWKRIQSPL